MVINTIAVDCWALGTRKAERKLETLLDLFDSLFTHRYHETRLTIVIMRSDFSAFILLFPFWDSFVRSFALCRLHRMLARLFKNSG